MLIKCVTFSKFQNNFEHTFLDFYKKSKHIFILCVINIQYGRYLCNSYINMIFRHKDKFFSLSILIHLIFPNILH